MTFNWKSIKFPILLILSFALWCFCFRGFLANELSLQGDAQAYSEHFHYFIDNLSRGVYPLWEPTREQGVPIEFFLRRIGEFNPFYLLILILIKIGIPYFSSYLYFLAFYYFLGMIGFYKVTQKVCENSNIAFMAYLLLMFSSLGTKVFESFILLIFVPMVWFFYFLMSFVKEPRKYYLLGVTFTLMIIVTTYIPFYFVTVFLSFLLCFGLVYFCDLAKITKKSCSFFKSNKLLTSVCLVFLILSLLPGIVFFQETKQGEFIIPIRHAGSIEENVFSVKPQTMGGGGIVITDKNTFWRNLNKLQLGQFYVPLFIFIMFVCGLFTSINRKILLLAFWGFLTYLISLNDGTIIYPFLYKKIFYFKYFRNFLFFLWVVLLPISIIFLSEQFKIFLNNIFKDKQKKYEGWILFIVSSCILFHPMIIYNNLHDNALKNRGPYRYGYQKKLAYHDFFLPQVIRRYKTKLVDAKQQRQATASFYLGTKWFYELKKEINPSILGDYLQSKLLIYDDRPEELTFDLSQAEVILRDSKKVEIADYNVNMLKLKTRFNKKKFLVFNDCFYTGWQVFIDGKQKELFRTNQAFKGVWVPKGEHTVYFRYGSIWLYVFKYFMMGVFNMVFLYLIFEGIKFVKLKKVL